jgi:HEAT repeat protein
MKRLLGIALAAAAAVGIWQFSRLARPEDPPAAPETETSPASWLERLYSQNPREVEAATREVEALGADALPAIQTALRDPQAEADRLKGALKACGILGQRAAPAIPEVAAVLAEQGLTAEAAIALSFMGRDAFPPLREALSSDDAIVRRESLRSIGKLRERASLDTELILPVLVNGLKDRDEGVRAVAATYLGIIHEGPADTVPPLIAALSDPDPEVRRSSAAALGSFDPVAAAPALPALRKASTDRNEDVAREAGRAIVKLQAK